jgi:hypothetical protein
MAVSVVSTGTGVNVGRDVTIFVAGKVDVTKYGAAYVSVGRETVIQGKERQANIFRHG